MDIFLKAMPFRLLLGLVFMACVKWAKVGRNADNTYPIYFYAGILLVYAVHQVMCHSFQYFSPRGFNSKRTVPLKGNLTPSREA